MAPFGFPLACTPQAGTCTQPLCLLILLPFILPSVSPDPGMGMSFRDGLDWVRPLDLFSEAEAQAEAPIYLKRGHIPPCPYPLDRQWGL